MALEIIKNIDVDFYNKEYILVNAKQNDKNSRFFLVSCYNQGKFYRLNNGEHSAYIRYRKSDNNSVFNFCEINSRGNIVAELTEQMLASEGFCHADLVIVNKGGAKVDASTGEIIGLENSSILSTMPIYIDVTETAVANSDIESSYEFNGLNSALEKAEAEYTEVMKTSKSWAVGGTGIRSGENTDNAKYYYQQSRANANSSTSSENIAKSYAVGGTGTRVGEDVDNAKYYSEVLKNVVASADGIIPMGTIKFADLATAPKATGYMYDISNDFVTDSTFVDGAGVPYNAGTNVYLRSDGKWDCFGGAATTKIETATADEVVEYLGLLM